MAITEPILREMDQEAAATRRLLERVPEEQLKWRPHPKSDSLGQLALHVAQIPGAVSAITTLDVFEAPSFQDRPEAVSRRQLLETFEEGLAAARKIVSGMDEAKLAEPWTLQRNGQVVFTSPRGDIVRTILLNHYYHHRGQLSVYLRMLDVPLPSIYGPSADENPFT
jgi:uncharacterized damage-inducible protein DinB